MPFKSFFVAAALSAQVLAAPIATPDKDICRFGCLAEQVHPTPYHPLVNVEERDIVDRGCGLNCKIEKALKRGCGRYCTKEFFEEKRCQIAGCKKVEAPVEKRCPIYGCRAEETSVVESRGCGIGCKVEKAVDYMKRTCGSFCHVKVDNEVAEEKRGCGLHCIKEEAAERN